MANVDKLPRKEANKTFCKCYDFQCSIMCIETTFFYLNHRFTYFFCEYSSWECIRASTQAQFCYFLDDMIVIIKRTTLIFPLDLPSNSMLSSLFIFLPIVSEFLIYNFYTVTNFPSIHQFLFISIYI